MLGDGTGNCCCQPPPHMTSRELCVRQLLKLVCTCAGGWDWQIFLSASPSHDKPRGEWSPAANVLGDGTGNYCCQPPPDMTSREPCVRHLLKLVRTCAGGRNWQIFLSAFPSHDKPRGEWSPAANVLGDGTGNYCCLPPPHMTSRHVLPCIAGYVFPSSGAPLA